MRTLLSFHLGQRVRIVSPDAVKYGIEGRTGTVTRLRWGDNGAWVEMDRTLPKALRVFPEDDSRARHLILYPDECREVPA